VLCSCNDDSPNDTSYGSAQEGKEREETAEKECESVSEESEDEGHASEDRSNNEEVEGGLRESSEVVVACEYTAGKSVCDLCLGVCRYVEEDGRDRSELVSP